MTYTPCPICGAAMQSSPHPTAASLAFVCPACYALYGAMPIDKAREKRQMDLSQDAIDEIVRQRTDTSRFRKERKERARELTRQREKEIAERSE